MSIRPRDYAPDISIGNEMRHQERVENAGIWGRVVHGPYGETAAETARPDFNPFDAITPPEYSGIVRDDSWSMWRSTKPSSYRVEPNEPGAGIDPTLVQIGNTPFWRSSNEPVEPWDCRRYPNSPYCGGSYNPVIKVAKYIQGIPVLSSTTCETCIAYQPSFLGIPGPVARVCYRKDSDFCRVPIPERDLVGDLADDENSYRPTPVAPEGMIRLLFGGTVQSRETYGSTGTTTTYTLLPGTLTVAPGFFQYAFQDGRLSSPVWAEPAPLAPPSIVYGFSRTYHLFDRWARQPGTPLLPGYYNYQQQVHVYGELGSYSTVPGHVYQDYPDTGQPNSIRVDSSFLFIIDVPCRQIGGSGKGLISLIEKSQNDLQNGFINFDIVTGENYFERADFIRFMGMAGGLRCEVPSVDVPLPKKDEPMDCCDEVLEQLELMQLKNKKIYNILGGDKWFKGDSETPDLDIDAETAINTVRSNLYRDDEQADSETVAATDLISLLAAYQAVLYQRSGFHRFPAVVPENLALDPNGNNDPELRIYDAMSWQEWLVKQVDALMGAWPIKVKYKDADGEESVIDLHNSSEAMAEIYGLLLSVAGDVDIQTELGFKTITEAIAAKVAATTAVDYAKGNAEFLGYKGNLRQKEIPMSITPGADTLKKALETSDQKVARWENEDQLDLIQLCTRILFAAEVVKSAFWDNFNPENGLRGGNIRDLKEQGSAGEEDSWQQFINELRNPTGVRQSDLYPRPDINNLPQEERDGN